MKMAVRTFPTAYKLKAIKRAEGGEGVLPVARKLGLGLRWGFTGYWDYGDSALNLTDCTCPDIIAPWPASPVLSSPIIRTMSFWLGSSD